MKKLSRFGAKFTEESGMLLLMNDLGEAASSPGAKLLLGGGNPARIPEVEAKFRERILDMVGSGEFDALVGSYDAPQGNHSFREALAALLRDRYGWDLSAANVALTSGSQTSFFFLFNLFAGERRKILLPLTPEYMGYADTGVEGDLFVSSKPEIELIGEDLFKYHVDFDAVSVTADTAAICVSRPTNPTANVLTEEELQRLAALAASNEIPLIIDNAYGTPFPNIIFNEAEPIWNEHVILTMSLSKLGLPGARTGIVVASEDVTKAVSGLNAIVSLAPSSFGAFLAQELVETGEIIELSRNVIRPFYERKCQQALSWIREEMSGLDYRVHKPEGTFFVWLWFPGLPVTSAELYQRLKAKGVLVVPGHYFFPGLEEDWVHRNECIRVNYSQDEDTVRQGIQIIANEVKRTRK